MALSAEHRGSRLVVSATAVGAFLVLVAIFYVSARHAFAGDSDGATVVLQGQAMGSGNLTLHGWALSLDSFWTVDAVVYMLVELVTGVRACSLFLVPSMIAASVVVVGALLARDGRRGIAGVAAATTVVVVLGLPSHVLGQRLPSWTAARRYGVALPVRVCGAALRALRVGLGRCGPVPGRRRPRRLPDSGARRRLGVRGRLRCHAAHARLAFRVCPKWARPRRV